MTDELDMGTVLKLALLRKMILHAEANLLLGRSSVDRVRLAFNDASEEEIVAMLRAIELTIQPGRSKMKPILEEILAGRTKDRPTH